MMTVEIKINGCLIGHIYAVNEGYVNGKYRYRFDYYDVGKAELKKGNRVLHKRDDGALVLTKKIIGELTK